MNFCPLLCRITKKVCKCSILPAMSQKQLHLDGRMWTTCQKTRVFTPLLDHMEKYLSSSPLSAGFIMKWERPQRSFRDQMGKSDVVWFLIFSSFHRGQNGKNDKECLQRH